VVIGLVLQLQGFKSDLFALKLLAFFWGGDGFSFVSLCEYTVRNESHLLHKSDT
jgi:hypothetical protein